MIRGVVFDMDGVMFDTEQNSLNGWVYAADKFGFKLSRGVVCSTLGFSRANTRRVIEAHVGEAFDKILEIKNAYVAEQLRQYGVGVKPGLQALLDHLKTRNYAYTVATSSTLDRAHFLFEAAGLSEYFGDIVCGSMVEHGKPAPDIFLKACEVINLPPTECLAIEDAPAGLLAAHSAGLLPVCIPDLVEPDEQIQKLLYARLTSLDDVIGLLETGNA